MARVLVTGAAGFMGSHVADHLLAAGHTVWALDDLSGGRAENVPAEATFVEGSILDQALLEALFDAHKFEYVFHLAAYAAEGLSHFIKRFNYNNNLIGSVNLINLAVLREVRGFVFTSSIAVYGENDLPMTEDMIPKPVDPYGIAKYAVEQELAATHQMFGLPYIVFRPHNVYGERQNIADRYRNVVGIFMNQVMQGQPMTVFGNGEQRRAFSHVDDVARAIARSIDVPGAYQQVFNIGSDEPHTVNHLAAEIARVFEVQPELQYLPARDEVHEAYSDHAKLARVLGNDTRAIPLEQGLARMGAWAREQGPQQPTPHFDVEIPVNLPESWKPERDEHRRP